MWIQNTINIIAGTLLILSFVTGFIAIFFTNFGTLIIVAGAIIYALMTGFSVITVKSVIFLLGLYVLGELFEYLFVIIGAKTFGASNMAVIGAIIGGIAGALVGATFLGAGVIIGTFIGIFSGAFIFEFFQSKNIIHSLKAGTGGVLGRAGSVISKIFIAAAMFAVMTASMLSR